MSIINGFSEKDAVTKELLMCTDRYNVPTIAQSGSNYIFTLDYDIGSYDIGKTVCIKCISYNSVTSFTNPYLNIGGIGNVAIDGTIKSGKYYQLVYDGVIWHPILVNVGVSADPIIFTTSGTYTIDTDLTYTAIVIGGGGGKARNLSDGGFGRGGGGGRTEGTYIPTSSSVQVVIGAPGNDVSYSAYTSLSGGTAGSGGQSSIETLVALGGKGGTCSYDTGTTGANGDGGVQSGFTINGSLYGAGGGWGSSTNNAATQGIVILYPIV